jgi:hypothetical protein
MPQSPSNLQAPAKTPQNTIALTCGILSILACTLLYLSIPLGVAAIILGYKGAKLSGARTARAGLVLGIIGIVLTSVIYLGALGIVLTQLF